MACLTAPAMVSPTTDLAPASRNAREHASSVAPDVITSSKSNIRKLSTRLPFPIAKAPRTASHRSSKCNRCFFRRGRSRFGRTPALKAAPGCRTASRRTPTGPPASATRHPTGNPKETPTVRGRGSSMEACFCHLNHCLVLSLGYLTHREKYYLTAGLVPSFPGR